MDKDTDKKFDTHLVSFKGHTAAAMDDALILATMSIQQFNDHGDLSYAQKFLDAMPRNYSRVAAFVLWLKAFSPTKTEGSIKDGYRFIKDKSPEATKFNLEGSAEKPFWEYAPAKEDVNYSVNDVLKAAERAVAKYDKESYHAKNGVASLAVSRVLTAIRLIRQEMKDEAEAIVIKDKVTETTEAVATAPVTS